MFSRPQSAIPSPPLTQSVARPRFAARRPPIWSSSITRDTRARCIQWDGRAQSRRHSRSLGRDRWARPSGRPAPEERTPGWLDQIEIIQAPSFNSAKSFCIGWHRADAHDPRTDTRGRPTRDASQGRGAKRSRTAPGAARQDDGRATVSHARRRARRDDAGVAIDFVEHERKFSERLTMVVPARGCSSISSSMGFPFASSTGRGRHIHA